MARKQSHPQQLPLPLNLDPWQTIKNPANQSPQALILHALSRLILQVARAQRAQAAVAKESADERS